jgi:hypothetical protein
MPRLKNVFIIAVFAIVLVNVSSLQYGEVSSRFDSRAPAEVPAKTVTGRHKEVVTLVRASINGDEPGWLVLSSGSYCCILDTRYIKRVNKLAKDSEIGISYTCKLPVDVHRAKTLTVGALTIKNLDIASFDLSEITADYDVEIVGVIGFPVFQHSVVRIEYDRDGLDDRVLLYDSKKYKVVFDCPRQQIALLEKK